jgi:DNA polymerase elongation subunit (family B)
MAYKFVGYKDYFNVLNDPEYALQKLTNIYNKNINNDTDSNDFSNSNSNDNVINIDDEILISELDSDDEDTLFKDNTDKLLKKRDKTRLNGKIDHDVDFQIIDIDSYQIEDEDEENKEEFMITLFGKTKNDKTVFVNVKNFKPYFYVEMDDKWSNATIHRIVKDLKNKVYSKFRGGLIDWKIVKKHKFKGFTNEEEFKFLKLVFNDYKSMRKYKYTFEQKHILRYISRMRAVKFNLYESNLHPLLRMFHLNDQSPNGWCRIKKENMLHIDYNYRTGICDYNLSVDWKNLEPIDSSEILKFKILSFDIECTSIDGKMPKPEIDGNKVIQIGMTYSLLGETECYFKEVLCLKKTNDIPGSNVICYRTEKDLLIGFRNRLMYHDPDVITGYNIFGFDYSYLHVRAKKHNIIEQFSRFSRVKGLTCEFVDLTLESSALGKNFMKYYKTPGRVSIDLMKVVQSSHKLSSYKLDFVAQTFINGDIIDYEYIYDENENKNENMKKEINHKKPLTKYEKLENNKFNMEYYSSDEEDSDIHDNIYDDPNFQIIKNMNSKKKIIYTKIKVKSVFGIKKNDFIAIFYNDGSTNNMIGKKKKIIDILDNEILLEGKIRVRPFLKRKQRGKRWKIFWAQAKDDVEAKDIFRLFEIGSKERAIVAKYCLKDCSLCNRLMSKLQILPNSIGMANVCNVPLSYLFLRGQGVKIFSLVAKQCTEENYLIPDTKRKPFKKEDLKKKDDQVKKPLSFKEIRESKYQKFIQSLIEDNEDDEEEDTGYEGATVFDPEKGIHYEPIIVDDYGSLYPSSMIMKNLSHNSIILDDKYDNLPEYKYHTQSYNNSDGTVSTYRFAERLDGVKATIPRILMKLLNERKKYKKLKSIETDPFKKAVWDGLQLAYKVTANSLYGQCGSSVSPIAMKPIAACTTAVGREMLELARDYVQDIFPRIVKHIKYAKKKNDDTKYMKFMHKYFKHVKEENVKCVKKDKKTKEETVIYDGKDDYFKYVKKELYKLLKNYKIDPKCIYGDTDSVFFKLNMRYDYDDEKNNIKRGDKFRNQEALDVSIKVGIISSEIVNYTLDFPQVLEYEKTFWPFTILTKKRYVGNKYEFNSIDYVQNSMGLVTKRRDNSDIVKDTVGGIIDQILNARSPKNAVEYVKRTMKKIITGSYDISKFIITKTLKDKESYADWKSQAHIVLADRITERDPGSKPQSNERLPYIYIEVDNRKVKLQGDRVEHPKYILENNLKIDYLFYITNQIQKPATQFLELMVKNPKKIFDSYIIKEKNRKDGIDPILKHCKKINDNEVENLKISNKFDSMFEETKKLNNKKTSRKKNSRKRIPKKIFK